MGRFSWIASVVAVSTLMGGCALFSSGDESVSTPVAESTSSQPSPQSTASPTPQSNPILIRPTDPDQRLRTLKSGRADPFGTLVSAAKGTNSPAGSAGPSDSSTTAVKAASNPATTAVKAYSRFLDRVGNQYERSLKPSTSSAKSRSRPSAGKAPTFKPGGSQPRLPALPQPDLAKGVQVTGIVSVAGVPRAIIKAPGESVSRSVTSGDRLANGQVLVKRIDLNRSEPVVILEQFGTEVRVGVGKTLS